MTYIGSDKPMIQLLVNQCYKYGIRNVIIAPGSRNAPLIISFANHPGFTCYSIIDERSAGFYALGMARQLKKPVALVCTSGTAVLNLAPAIAEAYYQNIPLVAITADRPPELIGQEDGQTINQTQIFRNFIKGSLDLPTHDSNAVIWVTEKRLKSVFKSGTYFSDGPVHINVPIYEPLYGTCPVPFIEYKLYISRYKYVVPSQEIEVIVNEWNGVANILVVCGVNLPNQTLNHTIHGLSILKNVPVLATCISNLEGEHIIWNVDKTVNSIPPDQIELFAPDLLITLGGPVVSKKLKQFIRQVKPRHHWDFDVNPQTVNTYGCLTRQITCSLGVVFDYLSEKAGIKLPKFMNMWLNQSIINQESHKNFLNSVSWADIDIYQTFLEQITLPIDLHLGNSSPVRYIEFFEKHSLVNYYTNRGTSGIDGSSSTAAGAALVSGNLTVLITGDVSFIYDSNALWNQHLPNNLRILVINNGGGNIFRIIPGPEDSGMLPYFETPVKASIQKICQAYGVTYLKANNKESFIASIPTFLDTKNKATVFEVFTPGIKSAAVFKEYLKYS